MTVDVSLVQAATRAGFGDEVGAAVFGESGGFAGEVSAFVNDVWGDAVMNEFVGQGVDLMIAGSVEPEEGVEAFGDGAAVEIVPAVGLMSETSDEVHQAVRGSAAYAICLAGPDVFGEFAVNGIVAAFGVKAREINDGDNDEAAGEVQVFVALDELIGGQDAGVFVAVDPARDEESFAGAMTDQIGYGEVNYNVAQVDPGEADGAASEERCEFGKHRHSIADYATMTPTMESQSYADLMDDFAELVSIVKDSLGRLGQLRRAAERHARPGTTVVLGGVIDNLVGEYGKIDNDLRALQKAKIDVSPERLISEKKRISDIVRSLQGVMGSMLASTDWQSPSFAAAEYSQAGTQTGKIRGTVNDYKRDHHADANNYERRWRREYIDAGFRWPPQVFVTASGMAAFSTVLTTLATEDKINGPILAGKACYFENKLLLEKIFPGAVVYVDEMNTKSVVEAIKELQPAAIFLDTIGNTEDVAAPDMRSLVPSIIETITRPTMLVLDATGTATSYQPLQDFPRGPCKLGLIVIESLLKYHQFGMDRVSAGLIWRTGLTPLGLFGNRMHLGTGLVDASVLSLPQPNRRLLDKRLRRMNRNANYLATKLEEHSKGGQRTSLASVVYPGLASHPAYEWMSKRDFQGSFLVLKLKPQYCFTAYYKKFLQLAINEARAVGVDLTAGSSFGFDVTRVYLTALYAGKHATPFLRVSVGTETRGEMEKLGLALTRALQKLAYRLPI